MPPRRRRPPRPGALADLAPLRILKQIILLQFSYYATALILIVFTVLAAGKHMTLDLLLSWENLRGDITEGWMLGLVWLLNSLIGVVFILLFIARSKLVPDFAITIHVIHLLVTSFYSHSIPKHYFWWALQIASTALMVCLGVWSCRWRELQPISFGGKEAYNNALGSVGQGGMQSLGNLVSFDRARGRSRTRRAEEDGVYEMLSTQEERNT